MGKSSLSSPDLVTFVCPLIAAFIGGCIGFVELSQRYPEPTKFIKNPWAALYIALNSVISLFGYWLLFMTSAKALQQTSATLSVDQLKDAVLAGFGSIALMRTKILNITGKNGSDFAVGPEVLVQSFLKFIDREYDRSQGTNRHKVSHRLMADVNFDKVWSLLPYEITLAMKQLEEKETETLLKNIAEIMKLNRTSQEKSYFLGYYLLDMAGEKFLEHMITDLKKSSPEILLSHASSAIKDSKYEGAKDKAGDIGFLNLVRLLENPPLELSKRVPDNELERVSVLAQILSNDDPNATESEKALLIIDELRGMISHDQLKALIEENREQLK